MTQKEKITNIDDILAISEFNEGVSARQIATYPEEMGYKISEEFSERIKKMEKGDHIAFFQIRVAGDWTNTRWEIRPSELDLMVFLRTLELQHGSANLRIEKIKPVRKIMDREDDLSVTQKAIKIANS